MPKREPQRTCVVCRKKGDKNNFFKISINKLGEIKFDKNKNLEGRGAYICKCEECLTKAQKIRVFNRIFKRDIPNEIYEELINEYKLEQN